jgi:hypothetical protein
MKALVVTNRPSVPQALTEGLRRVLYLHHGDNHEIVSASYRNLTVPADVGLIVLDVPSQVAADVAVTKAQKAGKVPQFAVLPSNVQVPVEDLTRMGIKHVLQMPHNEIDGNFVPIAEFFGDHYSPESVVSAVMA